MFQNIKVDIIYYKTATDFEMEFNLSGCCRMRLLTDKAPDRKTLVNQLVRAVSRSRIIMISGALFGDEGIISTCAKAVSKPKVKIDNKKFGIADGDDIEIIKDSIPLVSSEGIFGGCIIEQGPQTLILLSENKNIRKDIMQNLIHSYVKEVCAGEMTDKPHDNIPLPIEETLPTEEPIIEDAIVEENLVVEENNPIDEMPTDIVLAGPEDEEMMGPTDEDEILSDQLIPHEDDNEENIPHEDKLSEQLLPHEDSDEEVSPDYHAKNGMDISDELVVDTPNIGIFKKKEILEYNDFGNEAEAYVTDDEYDYKPKFATGINIPIIILTVLLLAVAIILCYSIFIVPSSEGVTAGEYLKETFNTLFG